MSDTPRPLTPYHNSPPAPRSHNGSHHDSHHGSSHHSPYDSYNGSRIHSHQGSRSHSKERVIEPVIISPSVMHNGILQTAVVHPQYPNGINPIPYPYKPHNPPFRDV